MTALCSGARAAQAVMPPKPTASTMKPPARSPLTRVSGTSARSAPIDVMVFVL